MQHVRGIPRDQTALFPERLEDFVSSDHPVRVVDAFMEALDLRSLGFTKATLERTGRPPYAPADMLKLYVYGYLNQIRSSRRLERECGRNVEVMWLMGKLKPDFKTIANFRKDNSKAIRSVCRAFVLFCREQELFGGDLVAIDGSKVAAAASRRGAFTKGQLERLMAAIDERIQKYLRTLDQSDAQERGEASESQNTREALEALQQRKTKLQDLAAAMNEAGKEQIVAGEKEATIMGHGTATVGYNLQTAVDEKNRMIVHHEVVQDAHDRYQLHPVATEAKAVLEQEALTVVADRGYHNAEQARKCEEDGIEPAVPMQKAINPNKKYYPKANFQYLPETDSYRCPADQELTFRRVRKAEPLRLYTSTACRECPLRAACTPSKQRWVSRPLDAEAMERASALAKTNNYLKRRGALVEHPFGTIKRLLGNRYLSRGLDNVRAESALVVLAYNMIRAINVLGVPKLLMALS